MRAYLTVYGSKFKAKPVADIIFNTDLTNPSVSLGSHEQVPHNMARMQRGATNLTRRHDLEEHAHKYAEKCVVKHNRDPDSLYGLNLYKINYTNTASARGLITWQAAVIGWISEAAQYNYTARSHQDNATGGFTQVVWRNSLHVGCAVKNCSSNAVFVCFYHPEGNIPGEYAQNVLPVTAPAAVAC
ncbi:hypothetical protein WJX73_009394 [Symbiochloris irregularis]|uniref:SCP domain-containing protein n=1 Tax=Symbiochloris irregularis TaxID=706552 RepID=A0AAW1PFU7_9CHLO